MYLSELRLWNFRKYGSGTDQLDLERPDLVVPFTPGLNVLIGENDSGKTAIIDAIKLVLKTHSWEWVVPDVDDFNEGSSRFRIECRFDGMPPQEAKNFVEWLGMVGTGAGVKPFWKVFLDVIRSNNRILPYEVRAGADAEGHSLSAEAREFLKVVFLRPLRDAEEQLISRKNSRLSQIMRGHEAFRSQEETHHLVTLFKQLNENIRLYFEGKEKKDGDTRELTDTGGLELKKQIDKSLLSFCDLETMLSVSGGDLRSILEALSLTLSQKNVGLGTYNRLFIAAELVHLQKKDWHGLRLGLIEELEAHLHPQAQLRVVEALQKLENVQLILTSHSPNLGSKVELKNLLICSGKHVFPMGEEHTKLSKPDYAFLERFLDVTKANLFFAKGVILVEGWAEELLLPAFAKAIGYDLTKSGVSVVNVGGTSFLRYANIFKRADDKALPIPVAVVTDLDLTPEKAGQKSEEAMEQYVKAKKAKYEGQRVRTFVSPHWTLEYCLALSKILRERFYEAVLGALKMQKEDEGVQDLGGYDKALADIKSSFGAWQEDPATVAAKVYLGILRDAPLEGVGKNRISKAAISQQFAQKLHGFGDPETLRTALREENCISYLIEAIEYACGTTPDN